MECISSLLTEFSWTKTLIVWDVWSFHYKMSGGMRIKTEKKNQPWHDGSFGMIQRPFLIARKMLLLVLNVHVYYWLIERLQIRWD